MKDHGTNRMTMIVKLGSSEAVTHLTRRFAMRSCGKTIHNLDVTSKKVGPYDFVVAISYDHTCHNSGNALSDARRFVHNAMKHSTYRYEIETLRPRRAA